MPRQHQQASRNRDERSSEAEDISSVLEFCATIIDWSNAPQSRRHTHELAGVPASALALLRRLERTSPMTVSELAGRLRLHQSTISTQLRPLVDQKLVRRTVDNVDRRVVSLSITRAGRDTCERVRQFGAGAWGIVLGSWSEDDRRMLAELMERARRDAEAAIWVSVDAADIVDNV
jgi:DNA-binding MarR family transcriptional regulator